MLLVRLVVSRSVGINYKFILVTNETSMRERNIDVEETGEEGKIEESNGPLLVEV